MDYKNLLLSCKGRIPRSVYWLNYYIPFAILYVVLVFVDIGLGTKVAVDPSMGTAGGVGIISAVFSLLMIYPSIAVTIKRIHDRGRTGWFMLVMFIPLVQLWPLIEVLFLKGTTGSNKYGDDPLQASDVQASTDQTSTE